MPLLHTAALLGTGILSAGTLFGVVATGDDTGTDPGTGKVSVPCGAVWDRLPAELRNDLDDLKALPSAERPQAVREIRREARTGAYGERVQQFAQHRDERVERVLSRLPDELRDDLRAARALPAEERAAALAEVRDRALAGGYGDRVQQVAERIRDRRAACAPAGSTSPDPASSGPGAA